MLKLVPYDKESRIYIHSISPKTGESTGHWSFRVPECVSSCEGMTGHVHTIAPKWTQIENGWEVQLRIDSPECIYTTRLTTLNDEVVEIVFTIENTGIEPMTDTESDFCFSCVDQPEFSSKDWYNRVYVHTLDRCVGEDGQSENKGEFTPIEQIRLHFPVAFNPNFAIFGSNIADLPLIMCRSLDGEKVYAGGFERCSTLVSHVGTCIHAMPWLGTIQPGQKAARRGRFYYMTGDLEDVTKRFCDDFGLAVC